MKRQDNNETKLSTAVKMASFFGNIPEESLYYPTRKQRLLVRICYQLQKLTGPDPFYLSWNQVASNLNISVHCAGSYLRTLLSDEIITVAEEHTETEATKYRYTGNANEDK
jgi:hypothetical protein